MPHVPLPEYVAAALAAHAAPLARHWAERAVAATPRPPVELAPTPAAGADIAEQVVRALADGVRTAPVGGTSAGAAPGQDARPVAEVMRLGWAAGTAAFTAGQSVHHVARDADLLLAVVLADVERVLAGYPPGPDAGPAAGVAIARHVQRAAGRYTQAALSGFVHALLRGLRERNRLLRHDLRNPLGTIRSALALMEDETVPVETRQSPGIRAMVARNAGSLDRLIGRRLDDASAAALLAPSYAVPVREVLLAARREVRDVARLVGCEVAVHVSADTWSHVDGAALERTVTAVLLAALARAAPGDQVHVQCADTAPPPVTPPAPAPPRSDPPAPGATCVVLKVSHDRSTLDPDLAPYWDEDGLRLALDLAYDHGGRLGVDAAAEVTPDAAALAAALARTPTVYLRLPFVEPGAEPPRHPGGGPALADGGGAPAIVRPEPIAVTRRPAGPAADRAQADAAVLG